MFGCLFLYLILLFPILKQLTSQAKAAAATAKKAEKEAAAVEKKVRG